MAKPSHRPTAERTFFVTAVAWERRPFLRSERMVNLLVEVLMDYRTQRKYHLHEFVIMPDHFHVLLTLGDAPTIERAVQLIKGGFSFRAKKEIGFNGEIWQRGFTSHIIEDRNDFDRHREYVLENPVRAGLAVKAEDYRYCSACPEYCMDPPLERFRG